MGTAVYDSRSEAEAAAVFWMGRFGEDSEHDWRWDTPTMLVSEPVSGFPCRVLVLTVPDADGFVPCLAFTAGLKYESRYWQGRLTNEDDLPLEPRTALTELETILEVLVAASQAYVPG